MIRWNIILIAVSVFSSVALADGPMVPVTPAAPEAAVEKDKFKLTCHQDFTDNNGQPTVMDAAGLVLKMSADGKGKYGCVLGREGTWSGYKEISPKIDCEIKVAFLETAKELWGKGGNGDFILKVSNTKEGLELSLNVGTRLPAESYHGARYKGKMSVRWDEPNQSRTETYKMVCDAEASKPKDAK